MTCTHVIQVNVSSDQITVVVMVIFWLGCVLLKIYLAIALHSILHMFHGDGIQVGVVRDLQKTTSCQRHPSANHTPQVDDDEGLNHLQQQEST